MRQRSLVPAFLALGPLLLGSGCVMPDQLAQIRKDVADVQQQLHGIEREQAETREKLEELETELGGGEQGVKRSEFADIHLRFDEIARNVAILDERVNDANRRMDQLSQNVQEIRELARRQPTVATGATPPGELQPEAEPGQAAPAGPDTGAGASPEAIPSPEALYNAAYADFSKGNYALAISGFEEYSSRFPDSDLADNALYWVGECYFSQGDFAEAVEAFDRLLERYPKSDRSAASNLKKGLAYLEQNKVGKAIVQLRYVLTTYPGSDESRIARDKLASLGASVH